MNHEYYVLLVSSTNIAKDLAKTFLAKSLAFIVTMTMLSSLKHMLGTTDEDNIKTLVIVCMLSIHLFANSQTILQTEMVLGITRKQIILFDFFKKEM